MPLLFPTSHFFDLSRDPALAETRPPPRPSSALVLLPFLGFYMLSTIVTTTMIKSDSSAPFFGPVLPITTHFHQTTRNPFPLSSPPTTPNVAATASSWMEAAAKAYAPPSLFSSLSTQTLVGKGASTESFSFLYSVPALLSLLPSFNSLLILSIIALLSFFFLLRFSHRNPLLHLLSRFISYVTDFFLFRLFGSRPVYCLDFETFVPPLSWRVPTSQFEWVSKDNFAIPHDSVDFCLKLLARSGLGEDTSFPPGINYAPANIGFQNAREEAETVIFTILDELFGTNGIKPKDVDILIVNCSLFNPTPSIASMIINHYGMKESIQSYNLSGMGCSAGVIAIHLARDVLQTHPNSLAVVISTENITQNIYLGAEKGMLISNSLFRCGGAAILLSNSWTAPYGLGAGCKGRGGAAYELVTSVRTHIGASDEAYSAVFQEEDDKGFKGVRLDKQLMAVAAKALKKNITVLAPKILPWMEQLKYGVNFVARTAEKKLWELRNGGKARKGKEMKEGEEAAEGESGKTGFKGVIREYVPRFDSGIQHFCIHAGGRGVIDAIQSALSLTDGQVAASRAVLNRFGNTSSSSIWYELEWHTRESNMNAGDKIWQIAFGSGFKCNSAIWKVINAPKVQAKARKNRNRWTSPPAEAKYNVKIAADASGNGVNNQA